MSTRGKRGLRSLADVATHRKRQELIRESQAAQQKKKWADEALTLLADVREYINRADTLTPEELQDCYEKHLRIEEIQNLAGEHWVRPTAEVFGVVDSDG